ncbi:hypothetical protein EIMP300_36340 [Escherichia coli]|uniref:3-hydroxyacyl-CoA dehydrogenase C-terminal domain-containing protein n=1 Tax=Escherichia coli TaxID=562 RepID=A0A8S0FPV1_ECOLX|nr:hypothetical protein EIMP300_36340 [Escherichia coli]
MPIVVRDKAGFYVNRILAPYINEAIRMLTEGERIEHIDAALVKFGFPVGPIQLLDEVGIDTGTKIMPVLEAAYGERFSASANVVSSILNDDRKGRKNGRGFYLYGQKGRKSKKQVDPAIYPLIGVQGQGRLSAPQVAERCVMLMLNEAVRCLDEQVIRSVRARGYWCGIWHWFSAISRWTVPLYRFSRRRRSGCNNATTGHAVWFPFYPLRSFS